MKKLIYTTVIILSLSQQITAAQISITQQEISVADEAAFKSMLALIQDSSLSDEARYKKVAKLLEEHPQIVNAHDTDRWTALIYAANYGRTDTVKLLITAGADLNAHNTAGYTALMLAVGNGHTEIVQLLITAGADINAHATAGYTALMSAASNGYTEIVKLLIIAGADLDAYTTGGYTVLIYAAWNGRTEIVQLLITAGADIDVQNDKDGNKRARDYAQNKAAYDAAVQAGLLEKARRERYKKDQAAAKTIITQEVTHIAPLVDIISGYAYNPHNPDDLLEAQQEIKETENNVEIATAASK